MSSTPFTCSLREAASRLGVSPRTARMWVEGGLLHALVTPGGHRKVLVESVTRLVEGRSSAGNGPASRILIVHGSEGEDGRTRDGIAPHLNGCLIEVTIDGYEALIRIGESWPDVLIIDFLVGGVDFIHFVSAVLRHARHRSMLIIVLVDSEIARQNVRARLPAEVLIINTPVDGPETAALIRAFLRNWNKKAAEGGVMEVR